MAFKDWNLNAARRSAEPVGCSGKEMMGTSDGGGGGGREGECGFGKEDVE